MKHLILLTLIQLSLLNLFAQKQDRVEDFRGLTWGASLEGAQRNGEELDFQRTTNSIEDNVYHLDNDPLSIGTVKLNAINYYFSEEEDRFYKVVLSGDRSYLDDMIFILDYKFGKYDSKSEVDGVTYYQWIIQDVTFTLSKFDHRDFELSIQSDWKAAEKYRKNTSVDDF